MTVAFLPMKPSGGALNASRISDTQPISQRVFPTPRRTFPCGLEFGITVSMAIVVRMNRPASTK